MILLLHIESLKMDIKESIAVTPKQLPELIIDIIKAKLVPNIISSPGLGKSDIVRQVANQFQLDLIDMRLSQRDVSDLLGFPHILNGRSTFIPPMEFPIEGDSLPQNKEGWILFLDEISSASLPVQASAYQLILDRMTGRHKLHHNVAVIAAGNKATDKAIVNRMSTALQSRMVHLTLKTSLEDWIEWADTNKIDYRVKGFIQFRPDLLHHFNPNHDDLTFPCPRTWTFLSNIISGWKTLPEQKLPIIAGTIGTGPAFEFKGYVKEYDKLPSVQELLNNPETVPIPQEPSTLFAISSLIGHYSNKDSINKLIKLINRLPKEFQVITLQGIVRVNKEMLKETVIKKWISQTSLEIF